MVQQTNRLQRQTICQVLVFIPATVVFIQMIKNKICLCLPSTDCAMRLYNKFYGAGKNTNDKINQPTKRTKVSVSEITVNLLEVWYFLWHRLMTLNCQHTGRRYLKPCDWARSQTVWCTCRTELCSMWFHLSSCSFPPFHGIQLDLQWPLQWYQAHRSSSEIRWVLAERWTVWLATASHRSFCTSALHFLPTQLVEQLHTLGLEQKEQSQALLFRLFI